MTCIKNVQKKFYEPKQKPGRSFKTTLRRSREPISAVKKSFFETSTRLLFWLIEFFLHIFYARYAYIKCSLESKKAFYITQSNTRQVEIIIRQEKVIFVDFKKMTLRRSREPISAVKKSFFETSTRLRLWVVE